MGAVIHALLHRVTFVTPGVPALVAVGVSEDQLNPHVSQPGDKGMRGGWFWTCFKDKKINSFHPLPSVVSWMDKNFLPPPFKGKLLERGSRM